MNFKELSRDEKLLIVVAIEVDIEENTFSGHNTAWSETVDLVLEGRKGLFDFDDGDLDDVLEGDRQVLIDNGVDSNEAALEWARRLSKIQEVSQEKKSWTVVPEDVQEQWAKEE